MNSASGRRFSAAGTRSSGAGAGAAVAEQPRQDDALAGGVLSRQVVARIGLGVAARHRVDRTAAENGRPRDTSDSTNISVPLTQPSMRSTRSPVSASFL